MYLIALHNKIIAQPQEHLLKSTQNITGGTSQGVVSPRKLRAPSENSEKRRYVMHLTMPRRRLSMRSEKNAQMIFNLLERTCSCSIARSFYPFG